jgi:hypothetical protein
MDADNAETIFNGFRRLRDETDSRTPEDRLESYRRGVLTSVEGLHSRIMAFLFSLERSMMESR